jgi:hypothetical protein
MMNDIPAETGNIQFRIHDYSSAFVSINSWEWENSEGMFYGEDAIEIIYPFISPNADYTFEVEFSRTDLIVSEKNITSTGGLGKLVVENFGEYFLSYNEGTKIFSLNKTPQAPSFSDPLITDETWEWRFWKNDWSWNTVINSASPVTSVILDSTFGEQVEYYNGELNGEEAFATAGYIVKYNGIDFVAHLDTSVFFDFPEI